jgi:glyoxylase-like metal-dependent hydrolase (beta-lactamase superfamily II)
VTENASYISVLVKEEQVIRAHLNRREFLLSSSLLTTGVLTAGQEKQDFSKVQIKVTHVSDSVYMLQGEGGNIAASVGDDGIAIVDDQFAPLAGKIRAALKDMTGKDAPVRFVINTHHHGDHTGGNANFSGTSTIIAQDNVRKRLEAGSPWGNGGSLHMEIKAAPRAALPIITFERDVKVHLNGEDIRALHFPAGHTDGDCIIFYPQANVVHMGDDFVRYGFPFIDIDCGGSVQGMISACENVISQVPSDVKVIPGHGDLSRIDDVRTYLGMLQGTTDAVEQALKQGKTLEEMKQQNLIARWHKFAEGFIKEDTHLETLYNSLTGKKNGRFLRHN